MESQQTQEKKIIFSGIQPSGHLTLGNYIGALKNWLKLQYEYRCCFAVVDLHSLTVRQDPKELRRRCMEFLVQYLACGIDPKENLIFFQSHVHTHTELAWILNCYTYMGELGRMTQFKDKSAKHADNINAGLFDYPVLMAADILLYQTDLVPVGGDQKQHLELTRDIAIRFNNLYGETFKVPEPYIPEVGARIMSLQEPTKKMSKSDENPNAYIALLDSPDVIMKKIKRAVTDSDNEIKYAEGKDGINNLLSIYSSLTGEKISDVEAKFAGKGYGQFKTEVAEVVIESLKPIQERYKDLMNNQDYVKEVYTTSAEKALSISSKTLRKVYKKVGFVPKA
ncbi:MAG: tryptophanyl-tRNA synthetase [Petroclostridium sp.]|jgi:tryptophanyl-tRNA synthetase|uniref:tryptophan--tRNA ligase n=1 Tax=Petroclostridium xylanilyticum TaxID=1792311 RepID=UPI000B98B000|nr:tryptophan--tRNA ligase [Petroclostridium xylanilyticum]MBZ4647411.1 tryptophanyl-tRNA synthetase [Clostridia bacterium]MDK2811620.1 tryptophanyl-tRNA synthetase [Petroclostridium sp.]